MNPKGNDVLTRSMIHYLVFAFLFLTAMAFVGTLSVRNLTFADQEPVNPVSTAEPPPEVILDPGHGGEDGGASGADGTLEKGLNLAISEATRDILGLFGIRADMTRSGDYLLYDYYNDLDDYSGKMKTYDLRNRLKLAETSGAKLFLGIHMNKFPQTQYSGLQVYYSPNHEDSAGVAQTIQTYAKQYLQPENNRETKRATSAIYLLKRITMPAVLVECGFLSNEAECALLNTREYRLRVSCVVAAAGLEYLT